MKCAAPTDRTDHGGTATPERGQNDADHPSGRGKRMSAYSQDRAAYTVPRRSVTPELLNALDPFYRAVAEVLIERGMWTLETGDGEE